MNPVQLDLNFACQSCDGSVGITVRCSGKGLMAGPRTVAATKVPCPICGEVNEVCFHPTGTVVAVRPVTWGYRGLVASLN